MLLLTQHVRKSTFWNDRHLLCSFYQTFDSDSLDQELVDYKIFGEMQQRVYQTRVHDVDKLKQRLIDLWNGFNQSVIDNAIDELRKRFRVCICVKGR